MVVGIGGGVGQMNAVSTDHYATMNDDEERGLGTEQG